MVLLKNSTTKCFPSRHLAVQFVDDWLRLSKQDSVLTMIIVAEPYEDFSVHIATAELSDVTEKNLEAWPYLERRPNT